MTYLVAADLARDPLGQRLRHLLGRPGILQMPGVHNGMGAMQAKVAGFDALYLSGAAMSASMGLPDLGIITVDDVCFFIKQIVRASGLPVLVDGDTGYGEVLNVMYWGHRKKVGAFSASRQGSNLSAVHGQISPTGVTCEVARLYPVKWHRYSFGERSSRTMSFWPPSASG